MRRKMIVMKKDELKAIIREAWRIEQTNPGLTRPQLWAEAEKVLPPDRQRKYFGTKLGAKINIAYKHWISSEGWKSLAMAHGSPATAGKVDFTQAIKEDILEAGPMPVVPEATPLVITVDRPVRIEPDYGKIPTKILAKELLTRLALLEEFDAKFEALAGILKQKQAVENIYKPNLDVRNEIRNGGHEDRPLRVAIYGPMKEQQQEIEAKCEALPKKVDLRFMRNDTNQQDVPSSVDFCIMTRFGRHSQWDNARQALGSDRVFFVDTPVKDVVQKLYDLCSRK